MKNFICHLPPELIIEIFNYLPEMIMQLSEVCQYFNLIARTHTKKISLNFDSQSKDEIKAIIKQLKQFDCTDSIKIVLTSDVNIIEKADFCSIHCNRITNLLLNDLSFLNPFIDGHHLKYSNLIDLQINNSDLTSCSHELPHFILNLCPKLINLKISHDGGSGNSALFLICRLVTKFI